MIKLTLVIENKDIYIDRYACLHAIKNTESLVLNKTTEEGLNLLKNFIDIVSDDIIITSPGADLYKDTNDFTNKEEILKLLISLTPYQTMQLLHAVSELGYINLIRLVSLKVVTDFKPNGTYKDPDEIIKMYRMLS